MTTAEIKKEWTKMSRKLKKIGMNYTCVMNAKQQRLGTATIMVDYIYDPAVQIADIEARMDDTSDARKESRRSYEYMKRNRKTYDTLFIPKAIEKMEQNPDDEWAKEHYQFCVDEITAYDNGTYLEYSFNYHKDRYLKLRREAIERLKLAAPFADQVARSRSSYADLIASEPVKAFMEATGASVHLEDVPDGYYTKVYARFSY